MKLRIFNKTKSFLEQINNDFVHIFKFSGKITKKEDKNCYILTVNNKILILYFLKIIGLSFGKKASLFIPDALKNKKLLKYFLAGLFDTDGFKTDTYGIMMQGSNYDFLKNITELLEKWYDIKSRKIYYGTAETMFGIKSRCQFQIKSKSMEKFINTIPLRHSRWKLVGRVVQPG